METADLHFHSQFSDGKFSVEWIAEELSRAFKEGCRLATLTDHDGIKGSLSLKDLLPKGMPFVCATELSCSFRLNQKPVEIHLLVYGISSEDTYLNRIFGKLSDERRTRFFKMAERLGEAGHEIDISPYEGLEDKNLGRPHLAEALIQAGHAQSMQDAFDRFLFSGSPYVLGKWRPELREVLDHCGRNNYITVLAHPGVYKMRKEHLAQAKEWGVSGVEVFHPFHSKEQRQIYGEWTTELGLKMAGGSDFHGYDDDFHSETKQPTLGRNDFPFEEAKKLLAPFL